MLFHHTFLNLYPVLWHREVFADYRASKWFSVTAWIMFGHFGVDAFIVLSGFCLMLPVVRTGSLTGGAREFFERRARRILPTYYAAIAFCGLVAAFGHVGSITFRSVIVHAALINDFLNDQRINGAFWSIAVETHIYLLFPLMLLAFRRVSQLLVVPVIVSLGLAVYLATWGHIPWEVQPHYVGLFAMGTLGALVAFDQSEHFETLRQRVRWNGFNIALFLVVVALSTHYFDDVTSGQKVTGIIDVVVGFAVAVTLVAASRPDAGMLRRVLEWKPLVFVGGFSYSLYLIHGPLLILFHDMMPVGATFTNALLMWFVVVPATMGIAYLFFLLFERPLIVSASKKKAAAIPPPIAVGEA